MAKRRRHKRRKSSRGKRADRRQLSPKKLGHRAFKQGEFAAAIEHWGQLDAGEDATVCAALAEAHFRRGLAAHQQPGQAVDDLQRAVELLPGEARYWYHLALALHRADQVADACAAYARAADAGYQGQGLGFARGLAEVEGNSHLDLETLSWLDPEDRVALAPVAALLRKAPQEVPAGDADGGPGALWQGLAHLVRGEEEQALAALTLPKGQHLRTGAEQVRLFYRGLAGHRDRREAMEAWTEASRAAVRGHLPLQPRLRQGLAQLQTQRLCELQQAGRWEELLKEVAASGADDPALLQVRLVAFQKLARARVEAGDWTRAREHWQAMGDLLKAQPSLGPQAPILRNLAIACEALEAWEEAAEAWGTLLGTLPRRAAKKEPDGIPVAEKRAWLRRRSAENFQRAGRPDRAIPYCQQAVKASPDDLDLRLELARALLANEQNIAARNEARRILDRDARQVEAHLLLAEIHQVRDEWWAAEQALQQVLEIDPGHQAARHGIAQMMISRGVGAFNSGQHYQAWEIYSEALQHTPRDIHLLVLLADTELVLDDAEEARGHLEAALATGEVHAYVEVFGCWVKHQEEKAARQVLARAEEAGLASAEFYIDAGVACLNFGRPSGPPGFFGRLRPGRREGKWGRWGRKLIDRGLECAPDRIEALDRILFALEPVHPAIAIEYARQRIALAPDEPEVLFALGLLEAEVRDPAAKKTLDRAARLARQQGQKELAGRIAQARRQIDNPLYGLFGPPPSLLDPEFAEEEEAF